MILESLGHDQYGVKVDGTGRITNRNRRFLRHYTLPVSSMSLPSHSDSAPVPNVPDKFINDSVSSPAVPVAKERAQTLPSEQDKILPASPVGQPVDSTGSAAAQTDMNTPMPERPMPKTETQVVPSSIAMQTVPPSSSGQAYIPVLAPSRPQRTRKCVKRYDASTGKWT